MKPGPKPASLAAQAPATRPLKTDGPSMVPSRPGFAVDVAAGHARDFAGGVQAGDRFEIFVQHAATQVGFDAAEVFPRQRKNLNRIIRRRVELLRAFERFAEFWIAIELGVEAVIVRFNFGDKIFDVFDAALFSQFVEVDRPS